jgi:cyclopropane fatty-acyl-phospholipid synthase-like methyltransferase
VEADPRSSVTLAQLRAIARDLRVGPGQTVIDLGCCQGGPGSWVGRETGAAPLSIDYLAHRRRIYVVARDAGSSAAR